MADISNRTLAIMMVVAILVSLGGLFISLDRLSKLQAGVPPAITGFGTSGTGKANVSIAQLLSITTTDDNLINFGTCTLAGSDRDITLESNWTCNGDAACNSMNVTVGYGTCVNATNTPPTGRAPDNLTIRNDGNQFANVTLTSSALASTIFSGTVGTKYLGYKTINESASDGACGRTTDWWTTSERGSLLSRNYTGQNAGDSAWTEITDLAVNYTACQNLSFGAYNKIKFQARMVVPSNEPSGEKAFTLTFTARTIVT